ncbi:DUF4113 domain-containing protein [Prolixibacteraceae bacterium]|nr:DUF4113 domain-containing protein [Prolixibacteraceae bacterium]
MFTSDKRIGGLDWSRYSVCGCTPDSTNETIIRKWSKRYDGGVYESLWSGFICRKVIMRFSELVDQIYIEGYQYKKAGVIVSDFVDENMLQMNLFEGEHRVKHENLLAAWDHLTNTMGKGTVRLGRQYKGDSNGEKRSPKYTTLWNELLVIGKT